MKRSGREGRWADIPSARLRFAAEAAFLILVAAGTAVARLSPLAIVFLMLVALVLVALIEAEPPPPVEIEAEEGVLPKELDDLVRESFADLIQAA